MSALLNAQDLNYKFFLELESLILAQNERWRQVLGMQVERMTRELALLKSVAHEWVTRGKLPFTGE